MREKKQIAGFILSPEWFSAPEKAEHYIREMAEHGYEMVDIFVRDTSHNLYNGGSFVHDAIRSIAARIHEYGMRCILDTDVYFWGHSLCERHPEASQVIYKAEEVSIRNGKFDFQTVLPSVRRQVVFDSVAAVFLSENGSFRRVSAGEFTFEWQNMMNGYQIKGKFHEPFTGKGVFYVGSRCHQFPDLAHEAYLNAQERILDEYSDIPFDGFGWDEPAKGNSNMLYYKAGEGFLRFFRDRTGYDLTDKLIFLDHCDDTTEAVRVRVDYYSALNEMNFEAQKRHNDYAEKLYGRKLFFGTHQTWSGLPADLAGGVVDYFRLGKLLSAAWTDGSWDVDLRYYTFHMMLADGLRNELGFRDAYYNDWGLTLPVIEDMHFANRFKMLFHVNWFNIFFSDFSEGIVNLRVEPARSEAIRDVAQLDAFDRFTDGLTGCSETAILYTWKGMAAAPKWMTRLQYASIGNTALCLADSGMFSAVISPEAIRAATVSGGKLICGKQSFKALIVPHAYVLEEDVYRKLLEIAHQGIAVVFYGVPPMFTDSGKCIGPDFARSAGFQTFTMKEYEQAFSEQSSLPGVNEWEKETFDFMMPVEVTKGIAERNAEDVVTSVHGIGGSLIYMTGADPREDLISLLADRIGSSRDYFADHAYYRWFRSEDGRTRVLLLCAHGRVPDMALLSSRLVGGLGRLTRRKKGFLRGFFRFPEGELKVSGGNWCAVRWLDGKLDSSIGDCAEVVWESRQKCR